MSIKKMCLLTIATLLSALLYSGCSDVQNILTGTLDGDGVGIARFTNLNNGTAIDNQTGLMWLQDANCISTNHAALNFDNHNNPGDGVVTWQQALDFVAGINDGTYTECGAGHTDWRLPTLDELYTLIDHRFRGPALSNTAGDGQLAEGDPFFNASAGFYWSATEQAGRPENAFAIGFRSGIVLDMEKSSPPPSEFNPFIAGRVWPVRAGNVPPKPRFIDNGNGTVTDKSTGLTWLQDANCISTNHATLNFDNHNDPGDGVVTWQQANDFVAGINNGTYAACGAGRTDWRLPALDELFSLVDHRFRGPALSNIAGDGQLAEGDPFINASAGFYWSSTEQVGRPENAFAVGFRSGIVLDMEKASPPPSQFNPFVAGRVWAVRGGN
jgi:hypothetical protein